MTRKHFIAIAEIVKQADKETRLESIVEFKENLLGGLCVYFKNVNPLFDEEKFVDACK